MMESSSYEADGFLVVRNAYTPKECEELDKQLEQIPLETRADWGVRFSKNCIERNPDILNVIKSSPEIEKYSACTVIYDEVVETLNTIRRSYPVHQDASYFPEASVSLSIALSTLEGERGGLSVVPGSHFQGLRPHAVGEFGPQLECDAASGLEPLKLERGDLVLVHPHLVHVMVGNGTTLLARMYSTTLG